MNEIHHYKCHFSLFGYFYGFSMVAYEIDFYSQVEEGGEEGPL